MKLLKIEMPKGFILSINILFLILILSGCNAPNQAREEEPIEAYLRAEINGELVEFEGVRATIGSLTPNWLGIYGYNYNNLKPQITPFYSRYIGFYQEYLKDKEEYDVMDIYLNQIFAFTGSRFSEKDGDVGISRYKPIKDSMNRLIIKTDTLDSGSIIIYGTFAMRVVVEETESEFSKLARQYPDTISITNGKFRAHLGAWEDVKNDRY